MAGRKRRVRSAPRGQHLLADGRLAADIVRNAGITRADRVLDIGAGTGILTGAIAEHARRVLALEVDPGLTRHLEDRFRGTPNVDVVEADALEATLPEDAYRVVANLPFHLTTAILRRLLDPSGRLLRADVVVQWELAIKRARQRPGSLLTMSWTPWFELTVSRRIPRRRFRPPPSVDAAVLTITRRPDPLLPPEDRDAYIRLLHDGFDRASEPVVRSLRGVVPPKTLKETVRQIGLPRDARPADLDAAAWTALYEAAVTRPRRPRS